MAAVTFVSDAEDQRRVGGARAFPVLPCEMPRTACNRDGKPGRDPLTSTRPLQRPRKHKEFIAISQYEPPGDGSFRLTPRPIQSATPSGGDPGSTIATGNKPTAAPPRSLSRLLGTRNRITSFTLMSDPEHQGCFSDPEPPIQCDVTCSSLRDDQLAAVSVNEPADQRMAREDLDCFAYPLNRRQGLRGVMFSNEFKYSLEVRHCTRT